MGGELKILNKLEEISRELNAKQIATGLGCLEGCGRCCFNPTVYCKPSELYPLAESLMERNEAQIYLEELEVYLANSDFSEKMCFLLKVTDATNFLGQCREYKYRPLLCRTFGHYFRKNKMGELELNVCQYIREDKPDVFNEQSQKAKTQKGIKTAEEFHYALMSVDPTFAREEELPINLSLKKALERVIFRSNFLK